MPRVYFVWSDQRVVLGRGQKACTGRVVMSKTKKNGIPSRIRKFCNEYFQILAHAWPKYKVHVFIVWEKIVQKHLVSNCLRIKSLFLISWGCHLGIFYCSNLLCLPGWGAVWPRDDPSFLQTAFLSHQSGSQFHSALCPGPCGNRSEGCGRCDLCYTAELDCSPLTPIQTNLYYSPHLWSIVERWYVYWATARFSTTPQKCDLADEPWGMNFASYQCALCAAVFSVQQGW